MSKELVCDRLREEALDNGMLEKAKEYAFEYMNGVTDREVFPKPDSLEGLSVFREELGDQGENPYELLERLHKNGSPATLAQTGGRYFGFVNGGIIPAALAAKWLTDSWDQNAGLYVMSPITSTLEDVCEKWLVDLFGFPKGTAVGFVSGSSTATICGLTAGRNHLLNKLGYDVGKKGLFGAPELRVVLGEGAHSTVYKALSILGLGSERVITVPMDEQGRIREELVPELDNHTLLILQAGNVNSGAFDPFEKLCQRAREAGAWVHVDGAFGLWAAASREFCQQTKGLELADSWSVDAHKTLNAPYDNGIVLCRDRKALTSALHMTGAYIIESPQRDGMFYTLDMSRRARAVEIWAVLKSLGKTGVAELVEELHQKAVYFKAELEKRGFKIHNEIVFNQVLVSHEDSETTEALLKHIQASGVCWLGGGKWEGRSVIRISVCSYRTTYEDIDLSVEAFVKAKEEMRTNANQ